MASPGKTTDPEHPQPVCQIKSRLLEELSAAALYYGEAACRLVDIADKDQGAEFGRLKIEAHNLHEQCERLRSDLEAHRAEHGC